jgi:tRNA (guanine37-N1)-methyltransferase
LRVDVVTLFPEMFSALTGGGVTGRAIGKGLLRLKLWNPRDDASDKHRSVDDRPYGGGPGMVMMVEPLRTTIRRARASAQNDLGEQVTVIHLTPQGRRLDQAGVRELAQRPGFVLICGRYEGIDERLVRTEIDEEWSIGDYVLSGGELPAMTVIDAVARLVPGVLGHEDSAQQDSFTQGLLDYPHYTRPETVDGMQVPRVLLEGDHKAIDRFRLKQALGKTWLKRPDLLQDIELNEDQQQLLEEFLSEHEAS